MASLVEEYQERYSGSMVSTEKVSLGRQIIAFTQRIAPQTGTLIEQSYRYIRILDDLSDESPYAEDALKLIRRERQALLKGDLDTALQHQYLHNILDKYPQPRRSRIISYLERILAGLTIDARLRLTQQPLTDTKLQTRNFLDLWPEVAALSLGVTGKDPKATPEVHKLMHAWGWYDNLSDLTEDLTRGLVLINREGIQKHNLHFTPGMSLPNEDLDRYYKYKRWEIMKSLRNNASALFGSGMPFWLAGAGYLYFQKTQLKLFKPFKLEAEAVYTPPLDSHSYKN